ncbi:MAG: type II secretion system protein GspL [Thiohalobacteraceae bacterium]
MPDALLIRFAPRPEERIEFVPVDENGRLAGPVRVGSVTEAALEAGTRRIIVLAPAADLLLTRVTVPTSNRARVRKAAPFALEDALAQDIEELHIALGTRDTDQQWPVAVVERARMDHWLEQLHEAGLHPDRVVPEPLALPLEPGSGSLLLEEGRALLRDQPWSAQAVSPATLPGLIELLAGRSEAGINLRVWHCGGELPTWLEPVSATLEDCGHGGLGVLAAGVMQAEGLIDLLQGSYSRKEQYGRIWRPWRAAAALLVASFVLAMVHQGLKHRELSRESTALAARIEQVYRDANPGGRVVDPRVQMEQQLAALRRGQGGGSSDFLGLIGRMGRAVAGSDIELLGANFRDGRLDLELTAGDIQGLDQLKQRLTEGGGLSVDIQSATAGANRRVQGRLRLQGSTS